MEEENDTENTEETTEKVDEVFIWLDLTFSLYIFKFYFDFLSKNNKKKHHQGNRTKRTFDAKMLNVTDRATKRIKETALLLTNL